LRAVRRAGCHESGSSSSREALRSKVPDRGGMPKFYPIALRGRGATETDSKRIPIRDELQQFEEVTPHTRPILTRGSDQSPSVGNSGESPAGSFNAVRRRELFFGDEEDRVDDNTRGRAETKPAAKSSTMNGTSSPCRSEHGETCRNANGFTPKGRGAACRVVPQKSRIDDSRKLRRAGKFGRTAKPRGPQNL